MWGKIVSAGRQLIFVYETLERHERDIKELREDLRRVISLVEDLTKRLDLNEQNERHEREKLCLRIENVLLNFERRLPPAPPLKPRRKRK